MSSALVCFTLVLLAIAVLLLATSNVELRQRLRIAATRTAHLEEIEERLAMTKAALAMANQLIEELQQHNDTADHREDLAIAGLTTITATMESARKRG